MSHHYYFVATLPSLQPGGEPPLTSAEFLARAANCLEGAELEALRAAALSSAADGEPSACRGLSPLLDGYYAWERSFRHALAKIRSSRLGRAFPNPPAGLASGVLADEAEARARVASQAGSPLEGELAVERERWAAIDSFLGYDSFSFEALAAYRLRLQSLERVASLTAERGDAGYRATYDAILGASNDIDLTGDLR